MGIKAIVTGGTGMVGEGVLHECLLNSKVESVLVINRKPCGVEHKKLKEIIVKDFMNIENFSNELKGYNACYFCAGVSSVGKKEEVYRHITYTTTMHFAKILAKLNPEMTFCYVSGEGTYSSEQGKIMWSRVKGKTENDLLKLPFIAKYMFRPGAIQPIKGLKNTNKMYYILAPFIPLLKLLFSKHIITLNELGHAMINVVSKNPGKNILENTDIREAAK